ncbi:MAG TPA: serine protease [Gemmataceae bacterium]|nr:serine protease [Gemmataceae bacterium]
MVFGAGCVVGVGVLIALAALLLKDRPAAQGVVHTTFKITAKSLPPKMDLPPEPVISLPRVEAKAPPSETPDGSLTRATLERVKDATVFISVNALDGASLTGSGFLALGPGLVLTNAHVVDMKDPYSPAPEQLYVTLWSGEAREKRLNAEVLGVDRDADLALLRFVENDEYQSTKMPAPLDIVASRNLRETQRVFVIGFPLADAIGKNVTISTSSVSSLRKSPGGNLDQVQVNGGMQPGNSGGPVVDSAGSVVGIAVSVIRGTQINFAVPCEKVFEFIAGRVLSAKASEAQPVGARLGVAVALKISDPLKNIQKLELEWWQGRPGPNRPSSLNRPEPMTGDGQRHALATYFDSQNAVGQAQIPLAGLPPPGQLIWVQPVLYGKDGRPSWGVASAHRVVPAPERKPAVLVRKHSADKQPLRLTVRTHGPEWGWTYLNASDTYMTEESKSSATAGPQEQRIHFLRAEIEQAWNGISAQAHPLEQQALNQLTSAGIDLQVDAQGNLVKATSDLNKVGGTGEQKKTLERYLEHIRLGLDALAVPLPGGSTEPVQKWQAIRPLANGPFETVYPAKLDMTYSFRGVRNEESREVGVLEIAGTLKPYQGKDRELTAKASGEAIVDLETGQIVRVNCTLEVVHRFRARNVSFPFAHRTVEMSLTRGNSSR